MLNWLTLGKKRNAWCIRVSYATFLWYKQQQDDHNIHAGPNAVNKEKQADFYRNNDALPRHCDTSDGPSVAHEGCFKATRTLVSAVYYFLEISVKEEPLSKRKLFKSWGCKSLLILLIPVLVLLPETAHCFSFPTVPSLHIVLEKWLPFHFAFSNIAK